MLKKFMSIVCVALLSVVFVGCEAQKVADEGAGAADTAGEGSAEMVEGAAEGTATEEAPSN